jgi:DHA2 family methylenomycin A resistance protein-like MFS transporter
VLNAFRQVGATLGVAVLGGLSRPLLAAAVVVSLTCVCYGAVGSRRRSHVPAAE